MSGIGNATGQYHHGRSPAPNVDAEEKQSILAAAFAPGAVTAHVAKRLNVSTGQLYAWRKELGRCAPLGDGHGFARVVAITETPVLGPPLVSLPKADAALAAAPWAGSSAAGASCAASAWASAASMSSSLSSSCSNSRRTRSDEVPKACRFRRAIWAFSFSASASSTEGRPWPRRAPLSGAGQVRYYVAAATKRPKGWAAPSSAATPIAAREVGNRIKSPRISIRKSPLSGTLVRLCKSFCGLGLAEQGQLIALSSNLRRAGSPVLFTVR